MENVPSGMYVFFIAARIAVAIISHVPGCAGCALNTAVDPAANAEAVSPPATENARGKLLAPNTPTGPNAFCMLLISGFGIGWRLGSAVSILASTHEPSF